MAMAPPIKVVLGSIAFAVFWVLAVFPAVPILPVGRTAGSLVGGMLMVLFRVITPDQAYAAIDLPILGLLFGTMVVSIYLERADMFKYLGKLLSYKSFGPRDLLVRICLISAVSSALFTNDTSCVVLTEFVLKVARQKNLPPHPFLVALASSANIGSAATPIGNPQNLVIAVQSGISFGGFLVGIVPSMAVGVIANTAMLLIVYWKVLSERKDDEEAAEVEIVGEDEVVSHRFSPATLSHANSIGSDDDEDMDRVLGSFRNGEMNGYASGHLRNRGNVNGKEINGSVSNGSLCNNDESMERSIASNGTEIQKALDSSRRLEGSKDAGRLGRKNRRKVLRKVCVYLITLGMLIGLLMGLNMSWTAITAALALVVLDFKDARPSLEKVSYSLLIFFCGMFISVEGFNNTGIPSALWNAMEPYSKIDRIDGTIVLAMVILVLSNVASNVPTVLLLGTRVAASAAAISPSSEKKAWLILAWVSTVAGNLSLLGSAANLIVCEQARRAEQYGYNLTFWRHLKFGVPSTIVSTAIGLLLIRGF